MTWRRSGLPWLHARYHLEATLPPSLRPLVSLVGLVGVVGLETLETRRLDAGVRGGLAEEGAS